MSLFIAAEKCNLAQRSSPDNHHGTFRDTTTNLPLQYFISTSSLLFISKLLSIYYLFYYPVHFTTLELMRNGWREKGGECGTP